MTEGDAAEEFGQAEYSAVGDRWLLRLSGEISAEMRPRLDALLDEHDVGGRSIDVDLGEVTFIDSSGIGFLARLGIENPGRVRVMNASEFARDLLTLSGLSKVFSIDPA